MTLVLTNYEALPKIGGKLIENSDDLNYTIIIRFFTEKKS